MRVGDTRPRVENAILNSPYEAPTRCFKFDADGITDEILDERRKSEFFVAVPAPKKKSGKQQEIDFLDVSTERVEPNELINRIRGRVDRWREFGYPGITPTTRSLLDHWHDPEQERRLFFCQLEAIETAIYLTEAAVGKAGKLGEAIRCVGLLDRYFQTVDGDTGETQERPWLRLISRSEPSENCAR